MVESIPAHNFTVLSQTSGCTKQSVSWEERQFLDNIPQRFAHIATLAVHTESAYVCMYTIRMYTMIPVVARGAESVEPSPWGPSTHSLSLSFLHDKQ